VTRTFRLRLAATTALTALALATAGHAQEAVEAGASAAPPAPSSAEDKLRLLEERVDALNEQIADLKASMSAETSDLRRTQEATTVSLANGRPTFATADGQFTASIRGVVHFDAAHYDQDKPGPLATDFRRGSFGDAGEASHARDLNDGTNFRRARLGVEGKLYGDFDYSLLYEFGGSGAEGGGQINDVWVQYSGIKGLRFRVGAFAPPTSLEDATSTNGSLFLERPSSAEIVRATVGGDGRTSAAVFANGERWFALAAWTGQTVGQQNNDEQSAVIGRVAFLPFKGYDWAVHLGGSYTAVLSPADAGPDVTTNRYALRLRDRPELRVDGARLIDTGNIDADGLKTTGLELAGQWRNFYVQTEYQAIEIARRNSALPDPEFGGWYAQASWIPTGQTRRYSTLTGGFDGPKVEKPFDLKTGEWGVVELGVRYSVMDLNFREGAPGTASPFGAVRGGEQRIWTLGADWYLNNALRIVAQWESIEVDRLSPGAGAFGAGALTPPAGAQVGQDLNAFAVRTQVAF
jgi:phosphate-selective porin OprO/OprP